MSPNRYVLAALFVLSAPAMGQNLYQDIQQEFADENQLQRDVRRYQNDVATGHYLRAAVDRARIQNDEGRIGYDQSLVQNDLAYQSSIRPYISQGQALVPHPQYPGYYYYPAQPGQLYYYPATQPVPPQQAVAPNFVGPPSPTNVPPLNGPPANQGVYNPPPPSKTIAVLISNPAGTEVPINFAVDGSMYSVPSGYTQKLLATTTSVIEFDRGGSFGDGRYALSEGPYEFRFSDKGWELFKVQARPPVPLTASTSSLPRNMPPRGLASNTAPSTTNNGLTATTDNVPPPPPVPDPVPPR